MAHLEQAVTDFGGIALRYGVFYGAANDGTIEPLRKRQFPIIGDGGGIWSWIHLDDAAAATVLALDHDGPAIYNVVDDDPAPVREWLPVLAESLGAKPPRRFPTWLARLVAGEAVVVMSTEARGASNAKAKRELGWTPRHPELARGVPGGLLGNQRRRSASCHVAAPSSEHVDHVVQEVVRAVRDRERVGRRAGLERGDVKDERLRQRARGLRSVPRARVPTPRPVALDVADDHVSSGAVRAWRRA